MVQTINILVCDDDVLIRKTMSLLLKNRGQIQTCNHSDEALQIIKNKKIHLLLLDVEMRTKDEGVMAISKFLEIDPDITILMLSGIEDYRVVKECIKRGATDYVSKSTTPEELEHIIDKTLKEREHLIKERSFNREMQLEQNKFRLMGESSSIKKLKDLIEKYKKSTANVLIEGETGTGKERVAKSLRKYTSDKGWEPFIAIDSATLHLNTAESILFGHEKGAFTGAHERKSGLFEEADGGVVFFDEIGNMPLEIQKKLLRIIQEKEVKRLGSNTVIPIDFRVIAATNRNLEEMVKNKEFLGDLYERLNVLPLHVPALREHKEDIDTLIPYYLSITKREHIKISENALEILKKYSWPGNVRELFAVLEYSLTLCNEQSIEPHDLPSKIFKNTEDSTSDGAFYERVKNFESNLLKQEYEKQGGKISKMAESLKMDRSHLHAKLKQYGIHVPRGGNE